MRTFCLGLLSILLCTSCQDQKDSKEKTPLVEVNSNFLYLEDLQEALPPDMSGKDSISFATEYIRNWVKDMLLFEKAKSNVRDNDEIEKMVESYRRTLLVHAYQQELIHQKFSREISDSDVKKYYETHKELFKLDVPNVKGLFIKLPLTAPQVANVRRWYKMTTHDGVEHLEKYSFQNAVKYQYFCDKWIPVPEISNLLPLKVNDIGEYFNRNRHIEIKDAAFYYFLNITAYRAAGDEEPYESAYLKVKDLLLNEKEVSFISQVKEELYQNAIKRKDIKYN